MTRPAAAGYSRNGDWQFREQALNNIRADLLRVPTLHGLLPLAGPGTFERRGNHSPRRFQASERARFYPTIHTAHLGSARPGTDGSTQRRVHFSRRRRLRRAVSQTTTMPRFSELMEFSRL